MKQNFPNEYFLKIIRCVKFYSSYQGMTSINNHLHGDSREEGVTYFHSHAREAEKGGIMSLRPTGLHREIPSEK